MSDETRTSQQESSSVEFNLHSSCYSDFFLLRIPICFNGHLAETKVINGKLMLVASQPYISTDTVSAQLSIVSLKAVSPVLSKYGVYQLDFFYHEQVPGVLYSINFRSKSSLKHFLTNKESVQKELALAINSVCEFSAKPASKCSRSPLVDVTCEVIVYLVSPPTAGNHLPKVRQVKLANYPFIAQMWQKSKLFDFTNAMFTDKDTDDGMCMLCCLPSSLPCSLNFLTAIMSQ